MENVTKIPEFVPFASYNFGQNGPLKYTSSLPWNPTIYCLIASFHATTYWTSLELTIHLFYTFKSRAKLYFWSILITTWTTVITTILLDLIIFVLPISNIPAIVLERTFTSIMFTGFSVILYSRLNLVTKNRALLRGVLYAIIATGILCNLPNMAIICIPKLSYNPHVFQITYNLSIVIAVQEIILSSIYIYLFFKFMRQGSESLRPRDKTTFLLLILAQLVIVVCDSAMITLIYVKFYLLRMAIVQFTYALKLRLEFVVLNRLAGPARSQEQALEDFQAPESPRSSGWRSLINHLPWRRLDLPRNQSPGTEEVVVVSGKEDMEAVTPTPSDPNSASTTPHNANVSRFIHHTDAGFDSLRIEVMEREYLGRFEAV